MDRHAGTDQRLLPTARPALIKSGDVLRCLAQRGNCGDCPQGEGCHWRQRFAHSARQLNQDCLKSADLVKFDGLLSLSLVNNFRPSATDTFSLMEHTSLMGSFGNAGNGTRRNTADNLASFEVSYPNPA